MSYLSRIAAAARSSDLTSDELRYYARHLLLPGIGPSGQRKLKAGRVLVVGAGGLGCPALQGLAGAGVGRVTVMDGDRVERSNLSRQWLHGQASEGRNKAASAAEALERGNPLIEVRAIPGRLTAANAAELVRAHDVVVDASDEVEVRYLLDEVCAAEDRPWVFAGLYRERAQLSCFWARYGATFRGLYPESGEAPSCARAGMLGAAASVAGHLQALEVVKLITACARPKVGVLVSLDTAGVVVSEFSLPGADAPEPIAEPAAGGGGMSVSEFAQARSVHQPMTLVDIRPSSAYAAGGWDEAISCPAETLLASGLPASAEANGLVVLLCEEGTISAMLADALCGRVDGRLTWLRGGLDAWERGFETL